MEMEFRNPKLNGLGGIDMEINHPVHGWIPFTADPNSGEDLQAEAYAAALSGAAEADPIPGPSSVDVNAERDRRIGAGFSFAGKHFAFDPDSKQRVTGAATLAGFALAQGAVAGNLLWHGGETPFAWIADDNTLVEMDAPTCFAFGQAAAAHETAHIFASRQLKDISPIPADYADDAHWP